MTAMLNVHDLRAYYGQVQALHGLSFSLNEGSLTTLLGANGAGKTTLLGIIAGELTADSGAVQLPRGATIGFSRTIAQQPYIGGVKNAIGDDPLRRRPKWRMPDNTSGARRTGKGYVSSNLRHR